MNPWHDIEPGKRAPEIVECIIEVPRGSRNKYELDKNSGLLRLDRVLYSAVFYPANYGFIPRTYCDDHDPLDILVLGQEPIVPMCIVTARPIGVMQMIDQDEEDDKIIAIHEHDPAFAHFRDINDLPVHTLAELQRFFEDYKALENKQVRIEHFGTRASAHKILLRSIKLYNECFLPGGDKRPDAPLLPSEQREASSGPSQRALVQAARRQAAYLSSQPQIESAAQAGEVAPANPTNGAGEPAFDLTVEQAPFDAFPHAPIESMNYDDMIEDAPEDKTLEEKS
jgi:inorganic pyrophosphatase